MENYTGERGAGVKAYSKDCIHWTVCDPPKAYSKTVLWSDGTKSYQGNLERPFIFFRKGKPLCIFFAMMTGTGFNGEKAWNMVIPMANKYSQRTDCTKNLILVSALVLVS